MRVRTHLSLRLYDQVMAPSSKSIAESVLPVALYYGNHEAGQDWPDRMGFEGRARQVYPVGTGFEASSRIGSPKLPVPQKRHLLRGDAESLPCPALQNQSSLASLPGHSLNLITTVLGHA